MRPKRDFGRFVERLDAEGIVHPSQSLWPRCRMVPPPVRQPRAGMATRCFVKGTASRRAAREQSGTLHVESDERIGETTHQSALPAE